MNLFFSNTNCLSPRSIAFGSLGQIHLWLPKVLWKVLPRKVTRAHGRVQFVLLALPSRTKLLFTKKSRIAISDPSLVTVQSFRGDTCVQAFRRRAQHKKNVCPVNRPKERFLFLDSEDWSPQLINPENKVQHWQELIFTDLENIEAWAHDVRDIWWHELIRRASKNHPQHYGDAPHQCPTCQKEFRLGDTSTQTHAEALKMQISHACFAQRCSSLSRLVQTLKDIPIRKKHSHKA